MVDLIGSIANTSEGTFPIFLGTIGCWSFWLVGGFLKAGDRVLELGFRAWGIWPYCAYDLGSTVKSLGLGVYRF